MKDSYIMHCDYDDHFNLLTDGELGRLIRDVNNYVKNGVLPHYTKEDRVLNMAFSFMKTNIDIETQKYIKKCEKNKENGKRGGRPKNSEKPNGFGENPTEAKKPDTDTETDTNTSVCNNSACENICHLGSKFKSESCFCCMKKHLCKNKESPDFKIKHPNETFESWDERKTEAYNSIIQNMKENGQAVVPEELLNYDWLNN